MERVSTDKGNTVFLEHSRNFVGEENKIASKEITCQKEKRQKKQNDKIISAPPLDTRLSG